MFVCVCSCVCVCVCVGGKGQLNWPENSSQTTPITLLYDSNMSLVGTFLEDNRTLTGGTRWSPRWQANTSLASETEWVEIPGKHVTQSLMKI